MPHVTMAEILAPARRNRYAIPNLWGGTSEKVIGHVVAAENRGAPLMLCYNEGLCPQMPMEIGVPLIVTAASHAGVPVATILDHGKDFDQAVKAMDLGISSVMFDGSSLPYEENVRRTRMIAEVAHSRGVSVEAELGAVGGSATETGGYGDAAAVMTDPDQVADFVRRTATDALAISFGNMHGMYRGSPRLDLSRVREIARRVDVPLVMHGGSGLSDDEYPRIIQSGISKINYYSGMARRAAENMRKRIQSACADVACHNLVSWNIDFYIEETGRLLDLFRCSGQAAGRETPTVTEELKALIVEEVVKAVRAALSEDGSLSG